MSDKVFEGSNTELDYRFKDLFLLDLDDTLVKTKSGKKFPENKYDYKLVKMVVQNLKEINEHHKIYVAILTNQGGIQQGFQNEVDVIDRIESVISDLKEETRIEDVFYYYSKTTDKDDPMRKPNTGMLDVLLKEHFSENPIPLEKIVMIGDASGKKDDFSDSDYKFAEFAGIDYLDVYDFQIKCTCGLRKEVYERKCKQDPKCWASYLEHQRKQEERRKLLESMTENERQEFFKKEAIENQKKREQWEKDHPEEAKAYKEAELARQRALSDEKEEQEKNRKMIEDQRKAEQEKLKKERDFLSSFGAQY